MRSTKGMAAFGGGILFTFFVIFYEVHQGYGCIWRRYPFYIFCHFLLSKSKHKAGICKQNDGTEQTKETQMEKTSQNKKNALKWQLRSKEFRKSLDFVHFLLFLLNFYLSFYLSCFSFFYQMLQKREVLSMGSTKGMAAFGGGIRFTFFVIFC